MSSVFRKGLLILLGTAAAASFSGCGPDAGDGWFQFSGTVTFDGEPVPAGRITFASELKTGEPASIGFAEIRDGRFQTRDGQGVVPGPQLVFIEGFDGAQDSKNPEEGSPGRQLFDPQQTRITLPEKPDTHDFKLTGEDSEKSSK